LNLLITGSRGFIGSCLTARATDFRQNVISLDDQSRGLNDVKSIEPNHKFIAYDCREGVAPILDEFEFPPKDIGMRQTEQNTKEVIFKSFPCDAVIHLAAGTGSLSRPYEELCELNIDMTKRIYADAVSRGVKVFVFPTTSLVEGVPDAPYVRSKQDAMDWLTAQNDDIKVIPLQFYNVTGAYADFSEHRKLEVHIIPVMLEKFMRNETFVVNGDDYPDTIDGTPGRDFSNVINSNVINVCDSILKLIDIQLHSPFKTNKPIKIGTGVTTTTKQMIDMFDKYMEPKFGRKLKWEAGPRRAYDCGSLRCDQPYLNIIADDVVDINTSLKGELDALLKVVYNHKC
jgi:UDP-glucose 4-epimerase